MADSPILTFEVYRDSTFLFREDLSAESITIGKGPAAMLRVEEDALQDLQAVVNVNDDGSVQLLDLVGEGTKVNGAGVVNASLNNGDTIEIGNIRIVVGFSGANEFDGEEATQMLRAPEAGEPVDDEATDHGGGEGGFALKEQGWGLCRRRRSGRRWRVGGGLLRRRNGLHHALRNRSVRCWQQQQACPRARGLPDLGRPSRRHQALRQKRKPSHRRYGNWFARALVQSPLGLGT